MHYPFIVLRNLRNRLNRDPFFVYLTFFTLLGVGLIQNPSIASPKKSLQNFLDQTTVTGDIGSSNSIDEIFFDIPVEGMLDINFSLILENAGLASRNTFGLYDTVSNNYFQIFDGEATVGNQLSATITSESQLLIGGMTYDLEGPVSFYLSRNLEQKSKTFLSNDIYSGIPQALMYQGEGEELLLDDINIPFTEDDYIIGFEDKKASQSDRDYNDMVVLAQTVLRLPEPSEPGIPSNSTGVPEPSLLSGLGMMAMLAIARKRTSES
ncbi:hypothetical protein CY0110_20358 [Crocosphaera chwakensis CCY0110]|uniref:DUF4114 domain-containing protein n=2 Tax=Crocosphaera TaxID=263510 RepID=A3ISL7_9CHRO|nr:hypothetical protein CY0110_20358 [Crocosphaera chwakensis CCY0110]